MLEERNERRVSPALRNKALLLAAITRNFLASLSIDIQANLSEPAIGGVRATPGRRRRRARSRPQVETTTVAIRGGEICLPVASRSGNPVLLRATGQLLATMPCHLGRSVVVWAPPVLISEKRQDGGYLVAANLVGAVLSRIVLSDATIVARILTSTSGVRTSSGLAFSWSEVPEIASEWLGRLDSMCHQHNDRIAREAGDAPTIAWLTRTQRSAAYARLQRIGGGA